MSRHELLLLFALCCTASANMEKFNDSIYFDNDSYEDPLGDLLDDFRKPSDKAIAAIYIIFTAVGLIANGIVLFVIFCGNEITKTVTAIYVVQLAIADCALLIVLPLFAIQHLYHHWSFGSAICTLCQTVKYINYYAGIFFLTAMSIDRYIAVVYSTKARQIRTITRTLLVCAGVWVASMISSLPIMMYAKTDDVGDDRICRVMFPGYQKHNTTFEVDLIFMEDDDVDLEYDDGDDISAYVSYPEEFENYTLDNVPNMTFCKRDSQPYASIVYEIFRFVLGYLLPFIVITVSYFLILGKLRKSEERLTSTHLNASSQTNSIRHKVTLMVIALVICFGLCWLPYQIYTLLMIKGFVAFSDPSHCYLIEKYTAIIGYSNSVFNPLLYTFLGQNFRKRLSDSWKKTRSRMQSGSRMVTNGHWRNTNKTASLSKRFSGLHFSRMQPAKNEQASTGFTTVFTDNEKDGKKTALLELQSMEKAEPLLKHSVHKDESNRQRNSL